MYLSADPFSQYNDSATRLSSGVRMNPQNLMTKGQNVVRFHKSVEVWWKFQAGENTDDVMCPSGGNEFSVLFKDAVKR
jgi:hypothetical protein